MNKNTENKNNLLRVLLITVILIIMSGLGVRAVTENINAVTIELSDGYEMTVLSSKTKVKDILEDNKIILKEEEKVSPNLESDISEERTIKISTKLAQEMEVAKISESETTTSLNELLNAYNKVVQKIETIEEKIPYETITKDISEGEAPTRNTVIQEGEEGIKRITYKVKYQNDTEIERNKISEETIKEPTNKIIQVKSKVVSTRSSEPSRSTGAVSGTVAEYQAYAKEKCSEYGWSDGDFNCLVNLWNKESGWNPTLRNSSSGAYGIPQSLPASKMAAFGSDYLTNYKTQINWGLSYIKNRYGSPTSAWGHFKRVNWY